MPERDGDNLSDYDYRSIYGAEALYERTRVQVLRSLAQHREKLRALEVLMARIQGRDQNTDDE